jgi:hypothetical protein
MLTKEGVMKNKKIITITAILIILLGGFALLLVESPISAQKRNENLNKNKPDVRIKVQKKTDKNGNITSYDSTYVSTWSSRDVNGINSDSLLNSFQQQFHTFSFGNPFGNDSLGSWGSNFYYNDSAFFGSSFNNDFFGHFNSNPMKEMEDMMKQHRAMMEHFFNNRHNYLVPSDSLQDEPQKATPQQNSYDGRIL